MNFPKLAGSILGAFGLTSCALTPNGPPSDATCMYPGQLHQLGQHTQWMSPATYTTDSYERCEGRGGMVLKPQRSLAGDANKS